jgi:hypothetical protein
MGAALGTLRNPKGARAGSHFVQTSRGEEGIAMLKNATYNLMETAAVLSKGLHRYETFRKDAKGCRECAEIWKYMRTTDEEQLNRILGHLKPHFAKETS